MGFCTQCGTKHEDGAVFCSKCGKKFDVPAAVEPVAPEADTVAPKFEEPAVDTAVYETKEIVEEVVAVDDEKIQEAPDETVTSDESKFTEVPEANEAVIAPVTADEVTEPAEIEPVDAAEQAAREAEEMFKEAAPIEHVYEEPPMVQETAPVADFASSSVAVAAAPVAAVATAEPVAPVQPAYQPQTAFDYTNPQAPQSMPAVSDKPAKGSRYAVLGAGRWLAYFLLFGVPVIGFVFCIAWACGATKYENKRNFARGYLIYLLIITALVFGTIMLLAFVLQSAVPGIQSFFDGIFGRGAVDITGFMNLFRF